MHPSSEFPLNRIRHVALDLDGTLYLGSRLLPGTLPFLEQLDALGIGHSFLTNNSSRSREDYLHKLTHLGIPARVDQIISSLHATIDYLRQHHSSAHRLFVLGTPSMQAELGAAGFVSCEEEPDAVVVGFDLTLTHERLCRAAWWISQGKPFIATHPDLTCPTNLPTILVDCGALCQALEAATGVAPVYIGKPSPRMLDGILSAHHLRPDELAMVGDRLNTDIALGHASGALSVLVLTGEATRAQAEAADLPPHLIAEDVAAFGKLLAAARGQGTVKANA